MQSSESTVKDTKRERALAPSSRSPRIAPRHSPRLHRHLALIIYMRPLVTLGKIYSGCSDLFCALCSVMTPYSSSARVEGIASDFWKLSGKLQVMYAAQLMIS